MSWLDLHMHSCVSMDGEFKPEELVEIAHKSGVRVMAISDHNIMDGVKQGVKAAKERDMICIPAVELDVKLGEQNFHILGYGIDPEEENLRTFCNEIRKKKQETGKKRMEKAKEMGLFFDEEKVLKRASQGHIIMPDILAIVFEDARNIGNPLVEKYRYMDMPGVQFFWDNCSRIGSPGYIREEGMSMEEGISLIKRCGGVSILAHPGANMGENKELFLKAVEAGIEGVEAFSSYHQNGEDVFYEDLAKKCGILITQGSDFHGKLKPQILAGSIDSGKEEQIYQDLCKKLGW